MVVSKRLYGMWRNLVGNARMALMRLVCRFAFWSDSGRQIQLNGRACMLQTSSRAIVQLLGGCEAKRGQPGIVLKSVQSIGASWWQKLEAFPCGLIAARRDLALLPPRSFGPSRSLFEVRQLRWSAFMHL